MNVFIGYESALEYWRSVSLELPGAYEKSFQGRPGRAFQKSLSQDGRIIRLEDRKDFLPRSLDRTPSFSRCKPSSEVLSEVDICGSGCFSSPISFVVAEASQRWRSKDAVCHVHGTEFPKGSFVRLSKNVCVASPELCFVQMATRLSLPRLLLLGYELCGTYTIHEGGCAQRPPLSTLARMRTFLERAGSMRGIGKARQSLAYLSEGSASPKESELALLLGLPRCRGGYGFGIPLMNYRVDFKKSARKSSNASSRYVDLFWPEFNLGIEYDSDQEHTGSERIARDASRKNALFAAGVSILSVTKKQLMSREEMDRFSSVVAKHMGVRTRAKDYDELFRREKLRQELLL